MKIPFLINETLENKLFAIGFFCNTFFVLIFCISTPYLLTPDSQGYINMDIYRSMGYPIFLKIFEIFGTYQLHFVKIFQIIFTIGCAIYLTYILKKIIQLQNLFLLIIYFFLLIPLVYEQKVGNFIISEGIAYPLYLLTIACLLNYFLLDKLKYFYFTIILILFLIQVRGQFLFMMPLVLLSLVAKHKKSILKWSNIKLLVLVVLIPIITILTDITFHKTQHNNAVTTPFTGIQIVSLPLYISNISDASALKTVHQKRYFSYIYNELKHKKLLLSSKNDETINDLDNFYKNYTQIANGTLSEKGDLFFKKAKNNDEKTILNDKMASSITYSLFQKNYQLYFKMYFQNVAKGIGSAKYLLLILLLLGLSLIKIIQTKFTSHYGFIYITTLAILGNVFIVGLAEPVISRYVFYNNWILVTIVLLLWQNAFSKIDE